MGKSQIDPVSCAKSLLEAAKEHNFQVEVRLGDILTITRSFQAGSNDQFRDCDMTYGSVLDHLPRSSAGSDWGTDGGGVGAIQAINHGLFKMNRSGGNKRVLKEIKRQLAGVQ